MGSLFCRAWANSHFASYTRRTCRTCIRVGFREVRPVGQTGCASREEARLNGQVDLFIYFDRRLYYGTNNRYTFINSGIHGVYDSRQIMFKKVDELNGMFAQHVNAGK